MSVDMSKHFSMPQLLRYSFPSICMMIFTSIYGIVDGIFVSNFAGKTAFAAINFIFPYIMILSVTGFMIGTGGSAIVSKTRGEGKDGLANRYFSLLVYFAFALGVILMVVGYFTMYPVSILLGADEDMAQLCKVYGQIIMISLPLYSLQYVFQSFFVTAGKPKLGLAVIIIAGVANMVLDALLVGVLGFGLEGAAAATVISEYCGGGIPVIYFMRKNKSFLRLGKTTLQWKIIGKACLNGSSEMVANIALSIVSMLYNYQLMLFIGQEGVAAYGVIMYTSLIFAAIFMGYNIGTSPLLSFQYGAQNHIEMRSILNKSVIFVVVGGISMLLLAEALAEPFSYIFTSYDDQLYGITVNAFRIFSICYAFMGFSMYGSAFFTALNNGIVSAFISFLRSLVFETSSVLILPIFLGVDGIWISATFAEVASTIVTIIFICALANRYGYSKRALTGNKGPSWLKSYR